MRPGLLELLLLVGSNGALLRLADRAAEEIVRLVKGALRLLRAFTAKVEQSAQRDR